VLEEEGIQEMTSVSSRLRHWNSLTISTLRIMLIGCKPLKGYLNLRSTMMKRLPISILKMKRYASLWYKHVKKNRAKKAKSKINTWSKLKKYMNKRFLPSLYRQELYLKITSHSQENLKIE